MREGYVYIQKYIVYAQLDQPFRLHSITLRVRYILNFFFRALIFGRDDQQGPPLVAKFISFLRRPNINCFG